MRSSDPSTTGTAVSSSASVYERLNSALNDFAKGEIRLHAAKQIVNARVETARFHCGVRNRPFPPESDTLLICSLPQIDGTRTSPYDR